MNKPIQMLLSGAGFIGREHLGAAQGLDSVAYIGVVDVCTEAAAKVAAQYDLPLFDNLDDGIASMKPDAVDICVPTPYHLPQVEICATHGVHVLCEKPMARTVEEARRMAELAEQAHIRMMIAQVIRFWPEYRYVRELAASRQYGEITAVDCKRLSSPPGWSEWLMDERQSGGVAIDLQIHDMDFVLQLLGTPRALAAWGRLERGGLNAVTTRLEYDGHVPVSLESSFLMPTSYPFRMFFRVEFERAVFEMDFWRPKGKRLKMFPMDGNATDIESTGNAYRDEIDYFATQLRSQEAFDFVPLAESITALELCCLSAQSCRLQQIAML